MQLSCKGQHKVKAGGELRPQANQKTQLWSWYQQHKADVRIVIVVSEFTTGISQPDCSSTGEYVHASTEMGFAAVWGLAERSFL